VTSNNKNSQVFLFIVKMLKPYHWSMSVMVFASIMWALELSLGPYMLKILLNRITDASAEEVFDNVKYPALFYISTSFFIITSYRLYNYFVDYKMFPHMRQKISDYCFDLILRQSNQYFQNPISRSLATKIKTLTDRVPDIIRIIVDRFLSHTLGLSVAIYTLWNVNINFALTMLCWVIIFTTIASLIAKKITFHSYIWTESRITVTSKIVDIISNVISVRLFARQNYEKSLLNQDHDISTKRERKLQSTYFIMWFTYGYSFLFVQSLNLYFLILGKQQGTTTIGDFALVMGINISIGEFLWSLTREFSEYSKIMGEVKEALNSILVTPEVEDTPEATPLELVKGKIEFYNVIFHYKKVTPLYNNLSIVINPGEKVGLVGYSGSGKSTFANLILRLFEINKGQILIDNQNIKDITLNSLRENIAIIPQEPTLFNRSLMENIRYGRLDASDQEVIAASKKAFAHEFILNLPNGYDTIIGEDNNKLSGGEKQRIAIARAFLKNSKILILDEATSQLDAITESQIQCALHDLMQNKTTLIIAHRLTTLLHMDRILVFEQGRIVEDGNHYELMLKNGLYSILWNTQLGDLMPEVNYAKI
jgi:ATP-binding cassette subfamily B protein